MNPQHVKVIGCYEIKATGLLTEIQHFLEGIPPGSELVDEESNAYWIVKKRVFHGILLLEGTEVYFENETETMHMDAVFSSEAKRKVAVEKELDKRKRGIYFYLLKPPNKKIKAKPKADCTLVVRFPSNQ